MSEHIKTDLDGGVLTVAFNRADKKNAITQAMYSALAEAVEGARTDDAVRVALFRSEGASFSAGNDIARSIALHGELSNEQRTRLLQIANACPVHKLLTGEVRIASTLVE